MHASPRDQRGSLCLARKNIHKAPCTWRTPPPSRGRSPILPVCKSYQQCKRGSARLLVLGVYPPPQPGQVPAITRMQKLSAAQEATYKKSFCAACTPPPSRGRSPLLPVRKSYQQCTNRPPHGKGVRFRVILYWLRQRVWVVVPLAEPHSGCLARLDPSRPSDLQRRLGLTSSPAARMPMYMARGTLACLGFRV